MCLPNIVLYFALLLVASSSESPGNSTNGGERSDNSTVQYYPVINSTKYQNDEMEPTQCSSCENFTENDEMQYESHNNSTKNDRNNVDSVRQESREQSNQMSMGTDANTTEINDSMLRKINENLTKTEGESNSTSNEPRPFDTYSNSNNNVISTTIVPYEACANITCVQLCCPYGNNITMRGRCVAGQNNYPFPTVISYESDDHSDESFQLTVRDPCSLQGFGRRVLNFNEYLLLANGSLYQGTGKFILPTAYCLAIFQRSIYDVIICINKTKLPVYISACLLMSLPFLLLTFVVYSILPDLQNMHGYTLRAHVASLFVTYAIMYFGQQTTGLSDWKYCVPLAYILNFSFLSSFFWLNVTCFDIWWTFRGFRSHQTNVKRDKKKFMIYSLYAWGVTFIINVICAIMDYVPGLPESVIRPEMCKIKFWFGQDDAKTLYFYVPMGATIIANMCFFTATTLRILYQSIHTSTQMRDSDSKRHNENKQRFNMYLKLFIVMGITWVLELAAWLLNSDFVPEIVWYPTNIINSLQGVIIFIIFVCRKKVKEMLLKQFSGWNCGFCRIPTNNDSLASTTSSALSMQDVNSSH